METRKYNPALGKSGRDSAQNAGLSGKLLIFDPLRHDRVGAQASHFVFLVVLEIALEPLDVAIAFEGENMRGDAVEEPAIVADDDGAAGEILKSLFQRAQRIDVE